MPTISVRVPKGTDSKEAKRLLKLALDEKLYPSDVAVSTEAHKLAVNPVELSSITRIDRDSPPGYVGSMLIAAAIRHESRTNETTGMNSLGIAIAAGVITGRSGQFEAATSIRNTLMGKAILMAEAPTGVGKTLAEITAAIDACKEGRRIVIAVPTIHLIEQIESEFERISSAVELPKVAYIIGKNNFIDVQQVIDMTQDVEFSEHHSKLKKWLKSEQAKAGNTLSTRRYLTSSFNDLGIVCPSCVLDSTSNKEDPGAMSYRSQFNQADEASIIVCTHAMLARDIITRRVAELSALKNDGTSQAAIRAEFIKENGEDANGFLQYMMDEHFSFDTAGVLPDYQSIIADEAHLLEQGFASASASDLSLRSLLKDPSIPASRQKVVRNALGRIVTIGLNASSNSIQIGSNPDVIAALSEIHQALSKVRTKSEAVKRGVSTLKKSLEMAPNHSFLVNINFSPIYKYPRLSVGLKTVSPAMRYMWQKLDNAVLVSATLLLPSGGVWSPTFVANSLFVPKERLKVTSIHAPEWLTSPVTLNIVSQTQAGARLWLCPPSMPSSSVVYADDIARYKNNYQAWEKEICHELRRITDSAEGGTLVLLSSYDMVKSIGECLLQLGERMVMASKELPLYMQKEVFVSKGKAGLRPVWIAVGGAWTGLNIVNEDVPAEEDDLLTDLVIPRIPFGMNQSITHAHRKALIGFVAEIGQLLMFLKQGMDRLVRREGVKQNRNIHFLDSRIYSMDFVTVRRGIELIFSGYSKRKLIQPGEAK